MAEQSGDKTQDATPHRRQQAREEGQVASSQDLNSAAILVVGLVALMTLGPPVMDFAADLFRRQLGGDAQLTIDRSTFIAQWSAMCFELAKVVLPILGSILLGAIAINLMQVGILFAPKRIVPDISRINPLKGVKRMVSLSAAMRLAFGIFKILIIGTVAVISVYSQWGAILQTAAMGPPQLAAFVAQITLWTTLKMAIALLILAIFDYAYQKWKFEQDLKMTTQEVREEMKNLQGDPQVAARRRAVQRQLALDRLSNTVPSADVVVTNPTELAIAIQYDPETMAAPIVVAKGAGVLAQRIRRLALEHNIPIVEKKPLAQVLYKEVDVKRPIPDKQYGAVAEVLAYVYRLKGKSMITPPEEAA